MKYLFAAILSVSVGPLFSQGIESKIRVGAERLEFYLPKIQGMNVAVVANHTSLLGERHLVDTLLSLNVSVRKIFCPEHGFRGNVEAGKPIDNQIDNKTKLPVISLYGENKKPRQEDLQDVDAVIFDLQDVGVRFYTYISTMHYVMEACAERNIPLLVLDRPNPNGFYVDGPVLDMQNTSFVGMHPVPLVHGLTVGEFAQMINGEGWLAGKAKCTLSVVPCEGYTHSSLYSLPVKPSPNLPNQRSVLLYPSLGFFEGTAVSVGRGTDFPFQVFGHPAYPRRQFKFKPVAKRGASINPPYKGKTCYGVDLRDISPDYLADRKAINLEWLIHTYAVYPDKEKFFNRFFRNLAGTPLLREQVESGLDADAIRQSWQSAIEKYMATRRSYLLYPDFEQP